jgi:hypothetical protein
MTVELTFFPAKIFRIVFLDIFVLLANSDFDMPISPRYLFNFIYFLEIDLTFLLKNLRSIAHFVTVVFKKLGKCAKKYKEKFMKDKKHLLETTEQLIVFIDRLSTIIDRIVREDQLDIDSQLNLERCEWEIYRQAKNIREIIEI